MYCLRRTGLSPSFFKSIFISLIIKKKTFLYTFRIKFSNVKFMKTFCTKIVSDGKFVSHLAPWSASFTKSMKIDADVELKVHIHEIQVYHCKAWLLHYIQIKTKQYETSVQLKVLHFYQILAIAMSCFLWCFLFS